MNYTDPGIRACIDGGHEFIDDLLVKAARKSHHLRPPGRPARRLHSRDVRLDGRGRRLGLAVTQHPAVYNALSPANRAKFDCLPADRAGAILEAGPPRVRSAERRRLEPFIRSLLRVLATSESARIPNGRYVR